MTCVRSCTLSSAIARHLQLIFSLTRLCSLLAHYLTVIARDITFMICCSSSVHPPAEFAWNSIFMAVQHYIIAIAPFEQASILHVQVRYHIGECFHHVSVPDAEDLLQAGETALLDIKQTSARVALLHMVALQCLRDTPQVQSRGHLQYIAQYAAPT